MKNFTEADDRNPLSQLRRLQNSIKHVFRTDIHHDYRHIHVLTHDLGKHTEGDNHARSPAYLLFRCRRKRPQPGINHRTGDVHRVKYLSYCLRSLQIRSDNCNFLFFQMFSVFHKICIPSVFLLYFFCIFPALIPTFTLLPHFLFESGSGSFAGCFRLYFSAFSFLLTSKSTVLIEI